MPRDDAPIDDHDLAAVQAALLALLAEDRAASETARRLRRDPAVASARDWVRRFDMRMIEVAGALVRKWCRRSAPASPGLSRAPFAGRPESSP